MGAAGQLPASGIFLSVHAPSTNKVQADMRGRRNGAAPHRSLQCGTRKALAER